MFCRHCGQPLEAVRFDTHWAWICPNYEGCKQKLYPTTAVTRENQARHTAQPAG
jgi:ssDNA-binding Zn-finger/Zn-ribbon topoisomerase 1